MTAPPPTLPLIERLPAVRGRLIENAELAHQTWFRVGGPAEVLFKPADLDDLRHFLRETPKDIPVTVIGATSNLIIRDGGVAGVVIRLGGAFAEISIDGNRLQVGTAALDATVALAAAEAGIAGLEFMSGIPGSIGGGLRMNAGCYGREMKDIVVSARAVDRSGGLHTLTLSAMQLTYRHCGVPHDWIFVDAALQGTLDAPEAIRARMKDIQAKREQSQPIRARTGGSTFANTELGRAWELIDKAGCRGLKLGDAQISDQHCNFLINTGAASASDLETLGEQVKQKVKDATGADLNWEIQRIGRPKKPEE